MSGTGGGVAVGAIVSGNEKDAVGGWLLCVLELVSSESHILEVGAEEAALGAMSVKAQDEEETEGAVAAVGV